MLGSGGKLALDIALPGGWVAMSELEWVGFLHAIRGHVLTESVARHLNTYKPAADAYQADLIADILRRNLDVETLALVAKLIGEDI